MYVNILNKKVAVCTLGCKVNQYESDSMMDILKMTNKNLRLIVYQVVQIVIVLMEV